MAAFILAGTVLVGTLFVTALMVFAAGRSDSPSASENTGRSALTFLICGVVIFGLLVGSHWMPHIGW